jgi:hypothetical protein
MTAFVIITVFNLEHSTSYLIKCVCENAPPPLPLIVVSGWNCSITLLLSNLRGEKFTTFLPTWERRGAARTKLMLMANC